MYYNLEPWNERKNILRLSVKNLDDALLIGLQWPSFDQESNPKQTTDAPGKHPHC
jgi:hypothetical protein